MTFNQRRFTIGMEEEYFVVDRDSRDLVPDLPESLLGKLLNPPIGTTSPEFIRSQIEIGTPVCGDVAELGESLRVMRMFVSETVSEHNMAIHAASTAKSSRDRRPKAPPTRIWLTWIRLSEMPSVFEICLLCDCGFCDGAHNSSLPDSCSRAVQFIGSMVA